MLKKLFLALTFTAVSLFAINFQTASKDELMTIKGIGEKRASAIMKYRKSNKIKSATDLTKVPGIGTEIADNAKKGLKNAVSKKAKSTTKKATSKAKSVKERAKSKTKSTKEKASKKVKEKKTKAKKKTKKKAGDATKRAEKKAKKDSKKKVKK